MVAQLLRGRYSIAGMLKWLLLWLVGVAFRLCTRLPVTYRMFSVHITICFSLEHLQISDPVQYC